MLYLCFSLGYFQCFEVCLSRSDVCPIMSPKCVRYSDHEKMPRQIRTIKSSHTTSECGYFSICGCFKASLFHFLLGVSGAHSTTHQVRMLQFNLLPHSTVENLQACHVLCKAIQETFPNHIPGKNKPHELKHN